MTIREMIPQAEFPLLDTDLRDVARCVMLVELNDGRVLPMAFAPDGVPAGLYDICKFVADNILEYEPRAFTQIRGDK